MAGPKINELVSAVTDAAGAISSSSSKVISAVKRVVKSPKKLGKRVKKGTYSKVKPRGRQVTGTQLHGYKGRGPAMVAGQKKIRKKKGKG